jgi:transcriptional regulator with XRE-family HTH domain
MQDAGSFWGDLIRELREKQGVTQRNLALRAQVNRSTLRSIEAGLTHGDVVILERLLGFLGYELEVLERDSREERLRRQARAEENPDRRSTLAAQRLAAMI